MSPLESAVDALFRDYDRPDVPGASIGIFRDGEIVLAKGYGRADLENGAPADAETNYHLASINKQFTAMATILLKERGALKYDDPIAGYFDGLTGWGGAAPPPRREHDRLQPRDLADDVPPNDGHRPYE